MDILSQSPRPTGVPLLVKATVLALCLFTTLPGVLRANDGAVEVAAKVPTLLAELQRPKKVWTRAHLAGSLYRTCRTRHTATTKEEIDSWGKLLMVDRALITDGSLNPSLMVREVALVCIEELSGEDFYPTLNRCAPMREIVSSRMHGQVERFSIAEILPQDLPDLQTAIHRWLSDSSPMAIHPADRQNSTEGLWGTLPTHTSPLLPEQSLTRLTSSVDPTPTPLRKQLVSALMGIDSLNAMRKIAKMNPSELQSEGIVVVEHNGEGYVDEIIKLRVSPPLVLNGAATDLVVMAETSPYKHFKAYVFAIFNGDIDKFASVLNLSKGKPKSCPPVGDYNRTLSTETRCPVTLGASAIGKHRIVFGCGWCNGD